MSGGDAMRDPACIFCSIVAGDAPAERVDEDELTLSFMDIFPASDGHVLVITKAHVPDLFGLEQPHADALWRSTLRIAHAVKRALRPDGMNVHQSNGRIANQHVMHVHLHVIPRYADAGGPDRDRVGEFAARIRGELAARA